MSRKSSSPGPRGWEGVARYAALDVELQVFEGTDIEVRVLTAMQRDSEEGWVELDRFVPTSKDDAGPRSA